LVTASYSFCTKSEWKPALDAANIVVDFETLLIEVTIIIHIPEYMQEQYPTIPKKYRDKQYNRNYYQAYCQNR